MENCILKENGVLEITPSLSSSKHDFDFYLGKWNIHNRRLNSRLDHCTEWTEFEAAQEMQVFLNGLGNRDDFITVIGGQPFHGMSLRLFNPQTRLWSIYWADSNEGILHTPTVGSFEGNIGKFYDKITFKEQEVIVLFQWDKTDTDKPVWSQAFSADEGKTWEWNWYMYMTRVE